MLRVLATITAMYVGTVAGGSELLPVSALQFTPHADAVAPLAKPLKLLAPPPVTLLLLAHWVTVLLSSHCDPQNVTEPEAEPSPSTNEPPAEAANVISCDVALAHCPPASHTWTLTVCGPNGPYTWDPATVNSPLCEPFPTVPIDDVPSPQLTVAW